MEERTEHGGKCNLVFILIEVQIAEGETSKKIQTVKGHFLGRERGMGVVSGRDGSE